MADKTIPTFYAHQANFLQRNQTRRLLTPVKIPLTNSSEFALIDTIDSERVSKKKWSLKNGYVRSTDTHILIHRFILNLPKSLPWVDHKNRNPLDNTRKNLRICDGTINNLNKGIQGNNKSGCTGVYPRSRIINGKRYDYWVAEIKIQGRVIGLGYHAEKISAVLARRKAEKNLWNFINTRKNSLSEIQVADFLPSTPVQGKQ